MTEAIKLFNVVALTEDLPNEVLTIRADQLMVLHREPLYSASR